MQHPRICFHNVFRCFVAVLGLCDTGDEDVVQDAYFLKSKPAMRQGNNRLQRGKLFYASAEREAHTRKLEFNWRLITIPGCGHYPNDEMTRKVISLISDSWH
jgi:hypothetical protein